MNGAGGGAVGKVEIEVGVGGVGNEVSESGTSLELEKREQRLFRQRKRCRAVVRWLD